MLKYDLLKFKGSTTPPVEQMYIYAQKDMIPNHLKLEATVTYQQVKDEYSEAGSMLRTSYTESEIPASFFLRVLLPKKENMDSKIQF